uniref:Uncharacterized protein n=1 Tax=Romanomermis culicivorax TaxID=13658 RepID=A0A915JF56_ROMCU
MDLEPNFRGQVGQCNQEPALLINIRMDILKNGYPDVKIYPAGYMRKCSLFKKEVKATEK